MAPGICDNGEPPIDKIKECRAYHQKRMELRKEDEKRLKVPLFVGQFGSCSSSEACFQEITNVGEAADTLVASWAYWQFKGFGDFNSISTASSGLYDDEGELNQRKLRALTRTYIQQYQGIPKEVRFDVHTGDFASWFTHDPEIKKPSVLYYHEKEFYPNGFKVTALFQNETPVRVHTEVKEKNYLSLTLDNKERGEIMLCMTPTLQSADGFFES